MKKYFVRISEILLFIGIILNMESLDNRGFRKEKK